jgi:glycosyltransferase involved in cell wall biosynthesis
MPTALLDQLPKPTAGKTGWPWDVPEKTLPETLPDGTPWPKVTIVTPSYNQARYLEETIRSVLLQGYPHLEYIIMDGGSTDGSVEIIEKHAPWLAYWGNTPDRGQSHAINKGFARATGDWLGWSNSDDWYNPGGLESLITRAHATGASFVAGGCVVYMEEGDHPSRCIQPHVQAFEADTVRHAQFFDQPACLWKRALYEQAGPLDETLHYGIDWDFFIRCLADVDVAVTPATIAFYRIHEAHKTSGSGQLKRKWELVRIYQRHLEPPQLEALDRAHPWLPLLWRLRDQKRRFWRSRIAMLGLRGIFGIIRRLVLERSPALHPHIAMALELPHRPLQRPFDELPLPVSQASKHWFDDSTLA